ARLCEYAGQSGRRDYQHWQARVPSLPDRRPLRIGISVPAAHRGRERAYRHAPLGIACSITKPETAVLNTVLTIVLERWHWRKMLKLLARPKRFELLTPRFVVRGTVPTPRDTVRADPAKSIATARDKRIPSD